LDKAIHSPDFLMVDIENRLAMLPGNYEHGSALILTLVDFRHGMLVFGNECALTRSLKILAKAALIVGRQFESHGWPDVEPMI
jgi:hypothetical protein